MTTLWLTRIQPDLRHRDARRDLSSAVAMHHRIMTLFPDGLGAHARLQAGALFRAEDTGPHPVVLLQSQLRPDLDKLPAGYASAATKDLTPMLDALSPGLSVRYRIIASAVRKLGHTTRATTGAPAVIPLTGADADHWWQRQAEENSGLHLSSAHSTPLDTARGQRAHDKRLITHARTRFDGTAHIDDADLLRQRILDGIGRGKAYGCGLLTLAPARQAP
ncbi:type I-E CRISPR-associated protein Cas6/Cse3/CasE [Streptomyces sioyaensis]|uniref:type I-E CRISPR-associated protein Cas6/Cse3/CasE n=1 Tax=Streptomyces sioyaensis TaxID=67364 RepID=UPI001F271C5F|nr:type I-E CRISPR-associated protein Cas6/Cse3/CasE [Streptomyces sioyaensis]MCF3174863.1 type I-E CRISPR-associated protein Cas6/Cse3/CasE [Streptomyces sioyaensis]